MRLLVLVVVEVVEFLAMEKAVEEVGVAHLRGECIQFPI